MKSYDVTIQMKATEQYFLVVLFIMLYKVVLTFECVYEILWCDHSNQAIEQYFGLNPLKKFSNTVSQHFREGNQIDYKKAKLKHEYL